MMDLGATICTPRNPDCLNCPLKGQCLAFKKGNQTVRPVFTPKSKIPLRVQTAGVIENESRVLITLRPEKGLLGGMWEFPGSSACIEENKSACLKREVIRRLGLNIRILEPFGVYKHAYTHFRVDMHAFLCRLTESHDTDKIPRKNNRWVRADELDRFPMGRLARKIADKYISWKTN